MGLEAVIAPLPLVKGSMVVFNNPARTAGAMLNSVNLFTAFLADCDDQAAMLYVRANPYVVVSHFFLFRVNFTSTRY